MKTIIKAIVKLLIITCILFTNNVYAQVAINTNNASPDSSAILDVSSTDKGILIPRMTSSERTTISSPATGLMVYDTDENAFWYYNGTAWSEVGTAAFVSENNITHSINNTDDFVFGTDNLNYGSGTEYKFFFDKSVGAFRAGTVNGTNWDSLGNYSTAFGYNSIAESDYSFSGGQNSSATGTYAFSFGYFNDVTAQGAVGFGRSNTVNGRYSIAFGRSNLASEDYTMAFGYNTEATGDYATAFGENTEAAANYATAFGNTTIASGIASTAFGSYSQATGLLSTAFGLYNIAPSYAEVALGTYNTDYTPQNTTGYNNSDRLFVIGNGQSTTSRSDALVIYKSGDAELNGQLTISDTLHINNAYKFPVVDGTTSQVLMTDGNGALSWTDLDNTLLSDVDADTKIQVEEGSDEDIIRFDLGGTEFMRLDSGRIEITNTGSSVFLGEGAGANDDLTSNRNTFLGHKAGNSNTTGVRNVFTGYFAGYSNTTGYYNIFMGHRTGNSNTTGNKNVLIGHEAGYSNSTGSGNIFLGNQAGYNEMGSDKLYIENSNISLPLIYGEFDNDLLQVNGTLNINGNYDLPTVDGNTNQILTTDGSGTVSWTDLADDQTIDVLDFSDNILSISLEDDGQSDQTVDLSGLELSVLKDSDNNTKVNINTSDQIVFKMDGSTYYTMDEGRLSVTNTGNSVFIGEYAGQNDDFTSNNNTGIGYYSLRLNTTGEGNSALGSSSLQDCTGSFNTAVGFGSGISTTSGTQNVFIGSYAGVNVTTGGENVMIGNYAGGSSNESSKLFIDNSATDSPLIWGDFSNNRAVINGNDGDNSNNRTLFVNGSIGATSAFNNDSDRRLKTNIQTIPNALDKVLEMRGVTYQWKDDRETGDRMGFIAQEVEPILPEVVDNQNDHYTMQYAPITAVLVEAVKEQQVQIEALKNDNGQLIIRNEQLTQKVTEMEAQIQRINHLETMLQQLQAHLENQ